MGNFDLKILFVIKNKYYAFPGWQCRQRKLSVKILFTALSVHFPRHSVLSGVIKIFRSREMIIVKILSFP